VIQSQYEDLFNTAIAYCKNARKILAVDPMPLIPNTHKSHSAYVQYGSIWSEADRDPPPGRSAVLSQKIAAAAAAVNARAGERRVEHLETTGLVSSA
jgi:hypothetical protein